MTTEAAFRAWWTRIRADVRPVPVDANSLACGDLVSVTGRVTINMDKIEVTDMCGEVASSPDYPGDWCKIWPADLAGVLTEDQANAGKMYFDPAAVRVVRYDVPGRDAT